MLIGGKGELRDATGVPIEHWRFASAKANKSNKVVSTWCNPARPIRSSSRRQ